MKIGKVEKIVPNLNKKKKYVVHTKALNQVLKHGLVLKKVHRAINSSELRHVQKVGVLIYTKSNHIQVMYLGSKEAE